MQAQDLRIALFSGNYNYVRDGANQALNRLVGYLLRQGVAVRVYSPTTDTPAFAPVGDLVSVPSIALPGKRNEYRTALRLSPEVKADLAVFAPNMVHVSSPEFLGHAALRFARSLRLPVVASMHTRFETYPRYYGLGILEPALEALLRRFYRKCDLVVAPSESMMEVLRRQRMSDHLGIWTRGVDRDIFHPEHRAPNWRQAHGIAEDTVVVGFMGRLVMEKGLDVFADAIRVLEARGVAHRVVVIGDGPARDWFAQALPDATFVGFQAGADLGRAVASLDVLLQPSVTETFGNVTLEAMASGVAVVAAAATGSSNLVEEGVTGRLITPGDAVAFADAVAHYCVDANARTSAGQAGAFAADQYGWDAINGRMLDAYLSVIDRHGERRAR